MSVNVVGLGNDYIENSEYILKNYDVIGLFDNSNKKIGKIIDGFCVGSVSKLSEGDKCLICSSQYKYELTAELLSHGIRAEDIQYLSVEWVRRLGGGVFCVIRGAVF